MDRTYDTNPQRQRSSGQPTTEMRFGCRRLNFKTPVDVERSEQRRMQYLAIGVTVGWSQADRHIGNACPLVTYIGVVSLPYIVRNCIETSSDTK